MYRSKDVCVDVNEWHDSFDIKCFKYMLKYMSKGLCNKMSVNLDLLKIKHVELHLSLIDDRVIKEHFPDHRLTATFYDRGVVCHEFQKNVVISN